MSQAKDADESVAAAPLAVNAGGTLSPGANGVGALEILATSAAAGNVDFNEGSKLLWEVADWTGAAGTGYDHVAVTGSVSIASTALDPLTIDVVGLSPANFARGVSTSFTLLTASEGISGLASDNWAVEVSGLPLVTSKNFKLRVENGAGSTQMLVLTYMPTGAFSLVIR